MLPILVWLDKQCSSYLNLGTTCSKNRSIRLIQFNIALGMVCKYIQCSAYQYELEFPFSIPFFSQLHMERKQNRGKWRKSHLLAPKLREWRFWVVPPSAQQGFMSFLTSSPSHFMYRTLDSNNLYFSVKLSLGSFVIPFHKQQTWNHLHLKPVNLPRSVSRKIIPQQASFKTKPLGCSQFLPDVGMFWELETYFLSKS